MSQGEFNMQSFQYSDAHVLLFDQNRAVRKQTRSILSNLGFQTILEYQELQDVPSALCLQRVDLAILAVDAMDCGVLKLVERIRRQRSGPDPFIPILLTTWDRKLETLRSVVDSGADDVLLHPFSTNQMGERIGSLVRSRKPYVVTETYLGPDRRTVTASRAGPSPIIVPNALQARVQGLREMAPSAERIEETLADLRRLKLYNSARGIWHMANCLKEAGVDLALPDQCDRQLTKMDKSIRAFAKMLASGDSSTMRSLCRSLSSVVRKQLGHPPDERNLELLEKTALALRVAARLEYDETDAAHETNEAMCEEASEIGNAKTDLIRAVMG